MTNCVIQPSQHLRPNLAIAIPGDKSVSHRAAIFGALCEKTVTFTNVLFSEDCLNTIQILNQLGAKIEVDQSQKTIVCHGVGLQGLKGTSGRLDVGNSGTAIRLLTGLLAGQKFESQISGDHSIQNRPMKRVTIPLGQMGAKIAGAERNDNLYPPLTISPVDRLQGIRYEMPIASAQVKSAVILAGLYANGTTTVTEPLPCRNHTELMLAAFGYPIQVQGNEISVEGGHRLPGPLADHITIPSDISSAAFSIIGALMSPNDGDSPILELKNIGVNPTRSDLLTVLELMGARIEQINSRMAGAEPVTDLRIFPSKLKNIVIPEKMIPNIIDEIPILAMLGLVADGVMSVRHAEELRVKESDRIKSIVQLVLAMGGEIAEFPDGFELMGPISFRPFDVQSNGDHRIAMSAIVTGIAAGVGATVRDIDCINTSFPNFFECLPWVGANLSMTQSTL